jgi:uncharacterized phage-associated protein
MFPWNPARETQMAMTPIAALKRLCELKQWGLTNLEAQKLLYFAHMISLGQSNGKRPLVSENFQAWDYGPVLPRAYHYAKMFGDKPIKPFLFKNTPTVKDYDDIFEETLKLFGNLPSFKLVAESHWEDGAWAEYYSPGAKGIEIPNGAILEEYRERIG